jgi:hypothetical protein
MRVIDRPPKAEILAPLDDHVVQAVFEKLNRLQNLVFDVLPPPEGREPHRLVPLPAQWPPLQNVTAPIGAKHWTARLAATPNYRVVISPTHPLPFTFAGARATERYFRLEHSSESGTEPIPDELSARRRTVN